MFGFLSGFVAFLVLVWMFGAVAGMVRYTGRRLSGRYPLPPAFPGWSSIGYPRIAVASAGVVGGVIGLLDSAYLNLSWFVMILVAAIIPAAFTPGVVRIEQRTFGIVAWSAAAIATIAGITLRADTLSRIIWLALTLMMVAYAARRWMVYRPVMAPAAGPVGMPSNSIGKADAVPRPVRPPMVPEAIITAIGGGLVGQDGALVAWKQLLEQHQALFAGEASRPLVVIHAGPIGCGRVTMAVDLAEHLGLKPAYLMPEYPTEEKTAEAINEAAFADMTILESGQGQIPRLLGIAAEHGYVMGKNFRRSIIVLAIECPDPGVLPDKATQAHMREGLAGLIPGDLAALATVIPFRPLDADHLGAVAARVVIEKARELGIEVAWVAPEVLTHVLRNLPNHTKEQGARGVSLAVLDVLQRGLEQAKHQQVRRARIIWHDQNPVIVAIGDNESAAPKDNA